MYKTKPKDFTGCNPIVEEELKKGNTILCLYRTPETYQNNEMTWEGPLMVEDYKDYQYRLENSRWCTEVRPCKVRIGKKFIGIAAAAKWLEDNKFTLKNGHWSSPLFENVIDADVFKWCDKWCSDAPERAMIPKDWVIEDSEISYFKGIWGSDDGKGTPPEFDPSKM